MAKPLPGYVPYGAFARTMQTPNAVCPFEYGLEMTVQSLRTMSTFDSPDMRLLLQQEGVRRTIEVALHLSHYIYCV
ncbi:hypothetical protein TNCV_766061 [Trichonephila clavipes]|nr:hypothetical protein TNCV_766061 [Trichonephila clavipes]